MTDETTTTGTASSHRLFEGQAFRVRVATCFTEAGEVPAKDAPEGSEPATYSLIPIEEYGPMPRDGDVLKPSYSDFPK